MMADAKDPLEFLERGVGVFLDLGVELLRIELAPVPPTGFWSQRSLLGGGQIAVDRAPKAETPRGLGLGTAFLDEFDHPFS